MRIVLQPGETITVEFADSDGQIEVSFAGREDNAITVHADMPDNTFKRDGVIYREDFSNSTYQAQFKAIADEVMADETTRQSIVDEELTSSAEDQALESEQFDEPIPLEDIERLFVEDVEREVREHHKATKRD